MNGEEMKQPNPAPSDHPTAILARDTGRQMSELVTRIDSMSWCLKRLHVTLAEVRKERDEMFMNLRRSEIIVEKLNAELNKLRKEVVLQGVSVDWGDVKWRGNSPLRPVPKSAYYVRVYADEHGNVYAETTAETMTAFVTRREDC